MRPLKKGLPSSHRVLNLDTDQQCVQCGKKKHTFFDGPVGGLALLSVRTETLGYSECT